MEASGRGRAADAPQRGGSRGQPAAPPRKAGGGGPAIVRCGAKGRAPALDASAAGSRKGEGSRAATGQPLATCCRGGRGRGGAGLPPRHGGEDEDAALAPTSSLGRRRPWKGGGEQGHSVYTSATCGVTGREDPGSSLVLGVMCKKLMPVKARSTLSTRRPVRKKIHDRINAIYYQINGGTSDPEEHRKFSPFGKLINVKEEYGELSLIARQGSGSAYRSMYGGFVKWCMGKKDDGSDSIAVLLADEAHWKDLTVVPSRVLKMEEAIKNHDFESFAKLTCADSNQIHAVCLDTSPPIFYMNDTSHRIISLVEKWNHSEGYPPQVAYTFDAGPNAVLIARDRKTAALLLQKPLYYFPPQDKDLS
ncbi:uncharacterized protein LOC120687548 isoform X3 [Panicum virgatum]|nr:uncharacterized protein LOC120687548 isoform X3 [Panicum virgatum]